MKNTSKIYRLCTGVLCVAVSIMAILFSHVSSPAKFMIAIIASYLWYYYDLKKKCAKQ